MKRSMFFLLVLLIFAAPSCKLQNEDSPQLSFLCNESDHMLVCDCDCGVYGIMPHDTVCCRCSIISVSCNSHDLQVLVDKRTSTKVLCTGDPNGLHAK